MRFRIIRKKASADNNNSRPAAGGNAPPAYAPAAGAAVTECADVGGEMRFRIIRNKASGSSANNNSSSRPAADGSAPPAGTAVAGCGDVGGGVLLIGSQDHDGAQNGSKDESFFEAKPWFDSDSEDDFYSMRGDFTPSRGSTPDHQMQTSLGARISSDRLQPSLVEKKQKLIELLQEKQLFDDEEEDATSADSETGMHSFVHAEEHLKNSSRKAEKAHKSSRAGCFLGSTWNLGFKSCWKRTNEKKDK